MPTPPDTGHWLSNLINTAIRNWNELFAGISQLLTSAPNNFHGSGDASLANSGLLSGLFSASNVWSVVVRINGYFQAIGAPLMVIFFFIGFVKTTTFSEIKRPEAAIRMLGRFVIGQFIVTQGFALTCSVFDLASKMTADVFAKSGVSLTHSVAYLPPEFGALIKSLGLWESIGVLIVGLLAAGVIFVMGYVVVIGVYGRFFRLYIYAAFSPIPLASFGGDQSTWGMGSHFLKSFLAAVLEGVVVMFAICIFVLATNSPTPIPIPHAEANWAVSEVLSVLLPTLVNMFLLLGIIKLCGKLSRELLGLA